MIALPIPKIAANFTFVSKTVNHESVHARLEKYSTQNLDFATNQKMLLDGKLIVHSNVTNLSKMNSPTPIFVTIDYFFLCLQ